MEEVRSLADGLARSAAGGEGIWFIAGDRDETFFSYRELYLEARLLLGGLAAAGVGRGDFVVLQIEEHRAFLTVFWACVLGGIIPVPLAMGSQPDHRQKVWNVWRVLRRPWLVAGSAALGRLSGTAAAERPELAAELRDRGLAWEELARQGGTERRADIADIADIAPGDLAYLQFSSGSTGDPKGVELTHRNLLTNTGDLFRALGGGPDDALLGWMPLTHDMGLVGMHLMSLLSGVRHYLMPTQLFIRRPALWLKKASEHRATILCSPNFGYHYFLSSFKPEMAAGWDLSRVRICNGGEPISAAIAERFVAALAPWGFRDGSIFPSYGLAEACVCVTTTPPWEPLTVHRLDRGSLEVGRKVEPAGAGDIGVDLVDLGFPLAHCQVRIQDGEDRILGEDYVGHVEIRGDNVTRGYYGNPEATRQAIGGEGWLRTGDLGFLRAGRLVLTGRAKDMVIVGGINHYLHDVERLAEAVEGLEPGRVAACGLPRPEGGGESLVLCIYWKGGLEDFVPLAERVRDQLLQRLGLAVEEIVPVRRIPKTTSGKVQRYKLARSYAAGEFAESLGALRKLREAGRPGMPRFGERALLLLVREVAEKILGTAVSVDRPLGEQGFDSQKAVALAAALSRACGAEMPVSLAFDYPTPREIARFAAGEIAGNRDVPRESRPAGAADEPIAIVGFGCRFPGGASGAEGLWRVLKEGIDVVREIPPERWDAGRTYDPDPEAAGKMVTREGAFLDGIDLFDNAFFAISAPEAEALDPQQRLLLEVAWEALEHAGQDAGRLKGSATGVFVGICGSDYAGKEARSGDLGRIGAYSLTGNAASTAAGRISYVFGFEGPSVALDTACSSSLVALHLAAQSLRSGESTLALAGGVNLILTPEVHVGFSRLNAMARDGRCKTFDQAADGYGRGEGCGIVVLKRLSDALAAGDRILALVRGSAVNQDGATNGLTAPSGEAQQRVIRQALERAAVVPAAVRYVEAHGTGTPLGDPQEMRALAQAYGRDRATGEPLLVGSVKTNFGHTEAAAGVAGLLKTVLALTREEIPPSLHFKTPSPHIPWSEIAVEVPVAATPWRRGERPRLAGLSSFGFSGTNAHALIEEAPEEAPAGQPRERGERRVHLLPVSARSREALAGLLASYRPLLEAEATDLHDLCFTAAVRRTHHPYRVALVGASREQLLAQLDFALAEGLPEGSRIPSAASSPGTVFLFPGQGSQWVGMARDLLSREPVFRAEMAAAEAAFAPHVDWRLIAGLEGEGCEAFLSRIDRVQPALFAIQVSLAALWRSWGIEPDAVVGHSMGEVAAARVAGALSLADAARIICRRSRLLAQVGGQGAMASVELTLEEAREALKGREHRISVAASNGPRSTVLSGDPSAVDEVLAELETRGVFGRRIKVDVASHSHQMDALRDDLQRELADIAPRWAEIPIHSTVTGQVSDGLDLDTAYWVANLRQPVLFSGAIADLLRQEHRFFLEMSPHPILLPAVEQCIEHAGEEGRAHAVASLRRDLPEEEEMLSNLALLYGQGYPVPWQRLYSTPGRLVDLPSYPWQRRRFWLDDPPAGRRSASGAHPLLGRAVEVAEERVHYWETELDPRRLPYLEDHRVGEAIVFPAAGWLEMLAAATRELHGVPWDLEEVEFVAALALAPGAGQRVQLKIEDGAPGTFEILSAGPPGAGWQLHARGTLRPPAAPQADPGRGVLRPHGQRRSAEEHYRDLAHRGLRYGRRFQGVAEIWVGEGSALARVVADPALAAAPGYEFHPALLDACLQTFAAAGTAASKLPGPYLPVAIRHLERLGVPGGELWAAATWRESTHGESFEGDLSVTGPQGEPVLRATGVRLARLAEGEDDANPADSLFELTWILWEPPAEPAALPLVVFAGRADDIERLFRDLPALSGEGAPAAVLYLWGIDPPDEPDPDRIEADVLHLARFVQGLSRVDFALPLRLLLVTRGGVPVGADPAPVLPGQAALWGLGKALAEEHPELACGRVDLSPGAPPEEIDELLRVLPALHGATAEAALRGESWYLPRLVPARPAGPVTREPLLGRPYRAVTDRPGDLDRLTLRPAAPLPPGPGEVEVEVAATGLNFMNVMSALGTYPGAPAGFRSLGIECAGRVARVGPGVDRLAVGDEVLGLAADCLASHALSRAGFLAKKPAGLSFAAAAALPVAFLTAYHALHDLARLEAGESILIHSAAGGVGLAALHLARRAGALVYATAGSEEKRALLRSLGARQVMDSRSLDFADEVLAATGGRGVDVVLNSLAGPALRRSLALLAPCGRFVEIGKRDLYGGGRLDLALLRRGVSYFAVDLDLLTVERPALIERLLDRLAEQLAAGELIPAPVTEFPLSRLSEAFRFMAEGRHVGKIVLIPLAAGAPDLLLEPEPGPSFLREASYLITGGCGALGLIVAGWMLENGAGHVVLLGRGGASPEAAERIAELERRAGPGPAGGRLHVLRADVADEPSLSQALAEIERTLPPLRGVVHAAGVLADGALLNLEPEACRRVLDPKVRGAWNLHRLTAGAKLDFFVLFSSAASLFGSAGQATYTAANAFLDGLAHYRRQRGQPALAVNWGPVARIGLAATPERGGRLAAEGLPSLAPEEVPSLLTAALGLGAAQVGALHLGPALSHPLLSALAPALGGGEATAAESFRTRELLTAHLVEQVAKVLRCPAGSIAVDTPWKSLGLDSLLAIQLAKRLGASLGLPLSVTGFWSYPTVEQYRDHLAQKLGIEESPAPGAGKHSAAGAMEPAVRQDESEAAALQEIESLSDEEAERLLRQRLAAV